jgi:ribonuclease-3
MLSSVIAAHLFSKAPGDEGYFTKMRSKIVSREHLNELGKTLNLVQYIESKVPLHHFEKTFMVIFLNHYNLPRIEVMFIVKNSFKKSIVPYVDIARLEGKVISYIKV